MAKWLELKAYKGMFAESTTFVLFRSDTKEVKVGKPDWTLVGNPSYAYTHFWSDGSMFVSNPEVK